MNINNLKLRKLIIEISKLLVEGSSYSSEFEISMFEFYDIP